MDGFPRGAAAAHCAGVQNDHGTDGGHERRDHNETTPRKHGLNDTRPGKGALASLPMFRVFMYSIGTLLLLGCGKAAPSPPLFRLLSPRQTGVTFANTITTSDSFNIQNDVYIY